MRALASALLALIGAAFMLLAALGVLRMPDVFTRMHAATKAGALGGGLSFLAVAVHFGELGLGARALAAILFILLTAPVSAHVIGRAAYFLGVPRWEGTCVDEMQEDVEMGRLK